MQKSEGLTSAHLRIYVPPFHDDDIFQTTLHVQVPGGIQAAQVSGAKEIALRRLRTLPEGEMHNICLDHQVVQLASDGNRLGSIKSTCYLYLKYQKTSGALENIDFPETGPSLNFLKWLL